MVRAYNRQGWEYPCLVNASWYHFYHHIEQELGTPAKPKRPGLRTVRGAAGSSWEAWMLAAQREAARFRTVQRSLVSLETLHALHKRYDQTMARLLEQVMYEAVYLTDHAWNGSSPGSKRLNLAIRQRRLGICEKNISRVRQMARQGISWKPGGRMAVVNTLGWQRTCRIVIPKELRSRAFVLTDLASGEQLPVQPDRLSGEFHAFVPDVPAFGMRLLQLQKGKINPSPRTPKGVIHISLSHMRPVLFLGGQELHGQGGWLGKTGCWRIGNFKIETRVCPSAVTEAQEVDVQVTGAPPAEPYELRWIFRLPWPTCSWRGETGGGFVTPGASDRGGDSFLGMAGSIFSCGEGLSARSPDRTWCLDFAFDQSGMCGLGGRTTQRAHGTYHEKVKLLRPEQAIMVSTKTHGKLEWYLLATAQNHPEAFRNQGGARRWQFRCTIRQRPGGFNDAALYRFAAGCHYPGELVAPGYVRSNNDHWLKISGTAGVLCLYAARRGKTIRIDLYNTLTQKATCTVSGQIIKGRIRQTDILGRSQRTCRDGRVELGPLEFGRLIIS
jgi:hypothetical protein